MQALSALLRQKRCGVFDIKLRDGVLAQFLSSGAPARSCFTAGTTAGTEVVQVEDGLVRSARTWPPAAINPQPRLHSTAAVGNARTLGRSFSTAPHVDKGQNYVTQLQQCDSLPELARVVEFSSTTFDSPSAFAALSKLAALSRQDLSQQLKQSSAPPSVNSLCQKVLQKLQPVVVHAIPHTSFAVLANGLAALATLHPLSTNITHQLATTIFHHLSTHPYLISAKTASPVHLTNVLHAMAGTDTVSSTTLTLVVTHATPLLSTFSPQQLSDFLHSLAMLRQYQLHTILHPSFWSSALDAAQSALPHLSPKDLAQTVWALAVMRHAPASFLAATATAVIPTLPAYDPASLATLATAYNAAHFIHHHLLAAVATAATQRIQEFTIKDLAALLKALVALKQLQLPIFDQAATSLLNSPEWLKQQASPQDIATLSWAYACHHQRTGPHPHPALNPSKSPADKAMAAISQRLVKPPQLLHQMTCQDLSKVTQSLALTRHYNQELMDLIGEAAVAKLEHPHSPPPSNGHDHYGSIPAHLPNTIDRFDGVELAALVSAMATLDHYHPLLLSKVVRHLSHDQMWAIEGVRPQKGVTLQAVTSLIWSLLVLHPEHHSLEHLTRLAALVPLEEWGDKELRQMQALIMMAGDHAGDLGPQQPDETEDVHDLLLRLIPDDLKSATRESWVKQLRDLVPSDMAQQVAAVCQTLGLSPQLEAPLGDGLMSADVVVDWEGTQVAIEIDEPSHFARNDKEHVLGDVMLGEKLLRHRCAAVVVVPWWEWIALPREKEREQYLVKEMDEAVRDAKRGGKKE